jgi:hypothetical protein
MRAMTRSLINKEPDFIDRVLGHPHQLRACEIVADLTDRLRSLREPAHYYEFQRLLFAAVYQAEERRGEAARNLKRLQRGKPVDSPASGDWEVERAVLDRVIRQLRAVGDALAWRTFSYDRRVIIALAQNPSPGPMHGKEGLDYELAEVEAVWKREGTFALLHDLTNCLRIADVTMFTGDGPRLVEVKKDASGPRTAQMKRMQHVLDVINEGKPLQGSTGPSELFVASQPFKTRLKTLETALSQADEIGVSAARVGRQWVLICASPTSPAFAAEPDKALAKWQSVRARAFDKGGMSHSAHHLRGLRLDQADAYPYLAPFTIYPFDPWTCARLTCDLLTFESTLAWDRLAAAFRAQRFETECLLPDSNEPLGSTVSVLVARRGEGGVTLHGGGMNQILLELVELNSYVSGVAELLVRQLQAPSGVLVFANERATWK